MSSDWQERLGDLPTEGDEQMTIFQAATVKARTKGLAGLDDLPEGHALHITPCFSIHTFKMKFPLDLVWLSRKGEVKRVDRDVKPRRQRTKLGAKSVIEVKAGGADAVLAALGTEPPT